MKDILSSISNKQFKYLKNDNSLFLMRREDQILYYYEDLQTDRKQGNKDIRLTGALCNNGNKQGKWWACIDGWSGKHPP